MLLELGGIGAVRSWVDSALVRAQGCGVLTEAKRDEALWPLCFLHLRNSTDSIVSKRWQD